MVKLLLFIDNLGAGGAQRQLVGLAVLLKQRGYDVKVCYYQDSSFNYYYLEQNEVKHELIENADNYKKRIFVVAKYFRKENPDWVIAYQETPSLVACMAKILGGKFKLIVSERSSTQIMGKRERIRFFLYRWADAIVPNSYAQTDFLATHYPWMRKKLQTIHNFVDLSQFHPIEKKRRDIPIIVVAASVWPPKNVLGFIEAVKILNERNLRFRVEWYGVVDDKLEVNVLYRNECKQKLSEYDLTDIMQLLPKTQNIVEVYRSADFCCLPSLFEGTPNVICEAMASGLPIICSNVCDNARYVHEGENGFLFDPNEPKEMADKIEEALKMCDGDYSNYCQTSRAIAQEMLSSESFLTKYLKIIDKK